MLKLNAISLGATVTGVFVSQETMARPVAFVVRRKAFTPRPEKDSVISAVIL